MSRKTIRIDDATALSVVMKRANVPEKRGISILFVRSSTGEDTEIVLSLVAAEKLASDINKVLMSLIFNANSDTLETEKEFIDDLLNNIE